MKAPRFWSAPPGPLAATLAPLGALYGAAGRLRRSWTMPDEAGVPVVCVGNLVAGGAGKTPVTIAIARHLGARGVAAHLLTRGYGGNLRGPVRVDLGIHSAREVGDEPMLLAAVAPTWVARDRAAGARAAVAAGAAALIMDDGFQNPTLRQDLALLVVDGETGFGNGRIIPAGPLREAPADGLARADALIVMGEDQHGLERLPAGRPLPVLQARLESDGSTGWLRGTPVIAFAGIARPAKFFATLEGLGAKLVAQFAYADHHRYDPDEIMQMVELAGRSGATLVTTAKDYARLPDSAWAMVRILAVRVAWRDEAALAHLLAPIVAASGRSKTGSA